MRTSARRSSPCSATAGSHATSSCPSACRWRSRRSARWSCGAIRKPPSTAGGCSFRCGDDAEGAGRTREEAAPEETPSDVVIEDAAVAAAERLVRTLFDGAGRRRDVRERRGAAGTAIRLWQECLAARRHQTPRRYAARGRRWTPAIGGARSALAEPVRVLHPSRLRRGEGPVADHRGAEGLRRGSGLLRQRSRTGSNGWSCGSGPRADSAPASNASLRSA